MVVSGFQSRIERDVLHFLLQGQKPLTSAPKDKDSSKDKLNNLSKKDGDKGQLKNVAIFAGVIAVIAVPFL